MADNIKILNPFHNIGKNPFSLDEVKQEVKRYASSLIKNQREFSLGEGAKTLKYDQQGLWLGAQKFEDAPFKVDMEGNVTATSLSLSQYISKTGENQILSGSIVIYDGEAVNIFIGIIT
jgi:hypothetical protein